MKRIDRNYLSFCIRSHSLLLLLTQNSHNWWLVKWFLAENTPFNWPSKIFGWIVSNENANDYDVIIITFYLPRQLILFSCCCSRIFDGFFFLQKQMLSLHSNYMEIFRAKQNQMAFCLAPSWIIKLSQRWWLNASSIQLGINWLPLF